MQTVCPICDGDLNREVRECEITIGPEELGNTVGFTAPVDTCTGCGMEFHDSEWQDAADQAQREYILRTRET